MAVEDGGPRIAPTDELDTWRRMANALELLAAAYVAKNELNYAAINDVYRAAVEHGFLTEDALPQQLDG